MYEFLQSCSWWQLYLIAVGLNYIGTLISNTINWKNPFYDLKDPSSHFIIFSLILVPLFVLIIERDDTEGRVMVAMQAILLVPFLILVGNTPETAEERIARAEQEFQAEKEALEEAHRQEIIEAQTQVKLAEIEAKRMKLYEGSTTTKIHSEKLAQVRADLTKIKTKGVDYSKMSQPEISAGTARSAQAPSEPTDEQTKLILTSLWLGACFFLQRLFEKIFNDKGYALLAVCAAGFVIAFFTANYFLLGGSVTGGLMGSTGGQG